MIHVLSLVACNFIHVVLLGTADLLRKIFQFCEALTNNFIIVEEQSEIKP